MKIAFIIAMDSEAQVLTSQLAGVQREVRYGREIVTGQLAGHEIVVITTGVGKVNAAAGAQLALSEYNPEVLANIGVAGGLKPTMQVAGLYQVRAVVQYDFDLAQLNGTKIGTLNEFKERELPLVTIPLEGVPQAVVATGDRFNDSEVDFRFLVDDVGADLREMELGAIAHVAARAGVKCYSFKSVSDVHGSGSTTEQFLANLQKALATLRDAMPKILAKF